MIGKHERHAASWLGGLMCFYFAFVGTHSPYLSLYFSAEGMSVAQIGVLMTVPQALRILAPPFWGWLADTSTRPLRIVRNSVIVLALSCLLLFAIKGFWLWLAVLVVMFFFSSAIGPIVEGMLLGVTQGDTRRFGRVRVWGSVGFITAVTAVGFALDTFGLPGLPWYMLFWALCALITVMLMRSQHYSRDTSVPTISWLDCLNRPGIRWFFASAFWMIFAHAALYTLYSLYLERLGISKSVIGLLWALGVLAEIALFWWQAPLFERFAVRSLLLISFFAAMLRFGLIAVSADSLILLATAQVLHAMTFAVHHSASMKYLHTQFAGSGVSKAVSLYTTIAYGVGASIGGLSHAWIWEQFGAVFIFWAAAAASVFGALCCLKLDASSKSFGGNVKINSH